MPQLDSNDEFDDVLLDEAIAAVLSDEASPGPPVEVIQRLFTQWQQPARMPASRRAISRLVTLAAGATVVLGCSVFWLLVTGRDNIVLGDVAREFHKAKSIQFRILHYAHAYGDAEKTTAWRTTSCEECTFKSPGLRREVSFDEYGVPWRITTADAARGIKLELRTRQKEAVLTQNGPPTPFELRQGLSTSLTMLEDWLAGGQVRKELGTREIGGRAVVGLRVAYGDREADVWIDRQTRQIVRFLEPSAAVYDPENDPVAKKPVPAHIKVHGQALKGWMWTDIIYDPPLDEAQYVLSPPDDYKIERINHREPTEKDLLEWLEVFAHVRGGTFPDDENPPGTAAKEHEELERKVAENRTPWDEKFIRGYIRKDDVPLVGGNRSVVVSFYMRYHGTWHYQGKGVKLGDSQTPICWYRPQGASAYHVVYGDLSVRDVAPSDLPGKR